MNIHLSYSAHLADDFYHKQQQQLQHTWGKLHSTFFYQLDITIVRAFDVVSFAQFI